MKNKQIQLVRKGDDKYSFVINMEKMLLMTILDTTDTIDKMADTLESFANFIRKEANEYKDK